MVPSSPAGRRIGKLGRFVVVTVAALVVYLDSGAHCIAADGRLAHHGVISRSSEWQQGVERRLPGGFEYRHLGCFEADYFVEENITLALTALELTPNMCYERCQGLNSAYFATQKGEQCWCTPDTRFDYSRLGVGICDMWCGADGSTKCGGITAADVYALEEENDDDSGGGGAFFSEGGSGDGTYGPLMEVGDDSDDNNNDSLLLEQLLELHNAARCMHGAEPLEFSEVVAFSARVHASSLTDENHCGTLVLEEASVSGSGLGENVFVCAVPSDDPEDCFSPQGAMAEFYDGQLGNGNPAEFGEHATRVLWKSSTQLGCVLEGCESGGLTFRILVCLYAPPVDYDSSTGDELGVQTLGSEDCGYTFGG